jgi:hypothetical protein
VHGDDVSTSCSPTLAAVPYLDWDRLLGQVEKYHMVIPVVDVLRYIQANLNEPLPSTVPIASNDPRAMSSNLISAGFSEKLAYSNGFRVSG